MVSVWFLFSLAYAAPPSKYRLEVTLPAKINFIDRTEEGVLLLYQRRFPYWVEKYGKLLLEFHPELYTLYFFSNEGKTVCLHGMAYPIQYILRYRTLTVLPGGSDRGILKKLELILKKNGYSYFAVETLGIYENISHPTHSLKREEITFSPDEAIRPSSKKKRKGLCGSLLKWF